MPYRIGFASHETAGNDMDEGKAALYAAIIGFAAAVIGAAAGGWASWKAARHQVVGGATNEHRHWVRQERRQAYGQVLRACEEFMSAGRRLKHPLTGPAGKDEYDAYLNSYEALCDACSQVPLFGPMSVALATIEITGKAGDAVDGTFEWLRLISDGADSVVCTEAKQACRDLDHALIDALHGFRSACHGELVGDLA